MESLTREFSFADRGSFSFTAGGAADLVAGYARIQVGAGTRLPAGMAVLRYRQNGVLVWEASVPAMPLLVSGRTYAEVAGSAKNTGIAIVNPNSQPVTINFYFTDANGVSTGQRSTMVGANAQIVAFLNEPPFQGENYFQGTFTFTSSSLVSAIALRKLITERNELLMTTLPVTDLSAPPAGVQTVAHFAYSTPWETDLVLVNPTNTVLTGAIRAFSPNGEALALAVDAYTIPPRSSARIPTSLVSVFSMTGSIRITPVTGSAPSVTALFRAHRPGGLFRTSLTWTEAAVPSSAATTGLRLFVQNLGSFAFTGSTQTGIAIANPTPTRATIALELFGGDGTSTGLRNSISIPANGQTALFINEIPGFSALPIPFHGVLTVTSPSPVSAVGLLGIYNERQEFLITPTFAVAEAEVPNSSELLFPYFATGSGYETEFVLFSNREPSSGTIYFYDLNGSVPTPIVNQE